jgi:hypothetical protein
MKFVVFFGIFTIFQSTLVFSQSNASLFAQELRTLKGQFNIEQWAYVVKKGDSILCQNEVLKNETLLFPIASLTKVFAAIIIMKFVENQKLSLDDSIHQYSTDTTLPNSIKIKHLLSHTSQGEIGKAFYYSNSRYALLGTIIEKVSGKSFESVLYEYILQPAQMNNTFLLKDSNVNDKIGKIAKGTLEYGFSASGGLVSCIEDLIKFDNFLNQHLISTSKKTMFEPFYTNSPYGLGIFTQKIAGNLVVWGYGQSSSFSSLYIKIPNKNLTFILLANNNKLNNYPKLIFGDITTSWFALSFFEHFLLKKSLKNEKKLANALNECGLENYEKAIINASTLKKNKSTNSLKKLYLFYTLKLKTKSHLFDKDIEKIGKKLQQKEVNNPYLHFYLGNYYDMRGNNEKATQHFRLLMNLPNFDRNWYTEEAENYFNTP